MLNTTDQFRELINLYAVTLTQDYLRFDPINTKEIWLPSYLLVKLLACSESKGTSGFTSIVIMIQYCEELQSA